MIVFFCKEGGIVYLKKKEIAKLPTNFGINNVLRRWINEYKKYEESVFWGNGNVLLMYIIFRLLPMSTT